MEFGWSPEQTEHRERVRTLLAKELPADWDDIAVHGPGSDAQTAFSKIFCKKLADEGLLISHWPKEYGGNDMTVWDQFIMGEELWAAGEPRGPQYMNVNWIGPVLMRYGNEAQKAQYFPQIASGSVIWCQGFSEPSAGSDLASLRTKADKVEGGYLVNGAKIWTSYAGLATHCFLLARTSSAGKGAIVILLLDMTSPGVQVKQIPALIGEGDIHEVFFTDVFVPAENLLGEEGQAWEIITFALQNERIGIPRYAFSRRMLDRAAEKLKADGRFDNPIVRDRAGRALALCEAARLMVYRVVHQRATAAPQDAYGNLARWAIIQADHAVNDFMTEFMPEGLLGEDQMQIAHHQRAIAAGIASGAAEIQLNLAPAVTSTYQVSPAVDFDFSEDQAAILSGLEQLISSLNIEAPKDAVFSAYSHALDAELTEGGFLDITSQEGFGLLDGALIVEELAKLPVSVEVAASILIAPSFLEDTTRRPVAILAGALTKPARFLPMAKTLLVDTGDDLLRIDIPEGAVEEVETLFAYPYGRLKNPEALPRTSLGAGRLAEFRRRWRIAIAVEAAGLMQSALDQVLEHVKTRQQFGRAIGSFQAIQHRLVMAAELGQAVRWLAFKAAWSDDEGDAAIAATFAQDSTPKFVTDLHQFCGAMGLTLEFPLHHWTYRLRALLGELGGSSAQAIAAADAVWPGKASHV